MATLHLNFYADTLKANTDVAVILPTPDYNDYEQGNSDYFCDGTRFRVLYLLHGGTGDYSDWCRKSRIECYAQRHNIAIVMPSISNSFCMNIENGPKYFDFLTSELPTYIERILPIKDTPNDRYIAGLSMGGYAALRAALYKPERFAAAVSLSGALMFPASILTDDIFSRNEGMFGLKTLFSQEDIDNISGCEANICVRIKTLLSKNRKLPRLLSICGTEDAVVYSANKEFQAIAEQLGINMEFEYYAGAHNWDFWDTQIQRVLDWFDKEQEE